MTRIVPLLSSVAVCWLRVVGAGASDCQPFVALLKEGRIGGGLPAGTAIQRHAPAQDDDPPVGEGRCGVIPRASERSMVSVQRFVAGS